MKKYTLENKPETVGVYRRRGVTELVFITEPFIVETQEGEVLISRETVDGWDNGYYLAYPGDGTKPYSIAPSYVRANYEAVK